MKSNMGGFKDLKSLLSDFQTLEGRDIRDAIIPNGVVISKTPAEAQKRSGYEDFLKNGQSEPDQNKVEDNLEHFVKDIVRKHLG